MQRIVLLFLLVTQLAQAQNNLPQDTSETIVVTAQRQESTPFDLAESVSVLGEQALQQQVSRSTAEALTGVPGVWMQKTNHGGGSPFVRGLTGNQTLLLVDGIRLNNSTYRYGPNQYFNTISVLNIEQVEVVRGSGSVLYGSDAIGGAINVLTHSPKFAEAQSSWQATVLGRYISEGMEQSGGAGLEWSGTKMAAYVDYQYRDFGDLIAGGDLGKEGPSAYQEQAVSAKLKIKSGSQMVWTLAYSGVFQTNVGRYDQVAQRGYRLYQFDPQNRQLAYARAQLPTRKPLLESIEWTASWQNSKEGREKRKQDSSVLEYELDKVRTLGFNMQVQSRLSSRWQLTTGVETYWDVIESSATDRDLRTGVETSKRGLYPDGASAGNVAIYSNASARFNRLSLRGGLRYNFFRLNPNDENFTSAILSPQALVGNLSLHYQVAEYHALVGSIGSAFRAPNINDLSSFGSFDFGLEVPSPELQPEKSLNVELGYKLATAKAKTNLAFYRMGLYDLITRVQGTYQGQSMWEGEDVYVKANTSRAYIYGLEWDGQWVIHPKWQLSANLTYTYGEDVSKQAPMRRIPPLFGAFVVQFKPNQDWSFAWQNWWANRQDRLSGGDISDHRIATGGTPGWFVSNVNIGFRQRWIKVNGGIQNLLNEAYRIHGSGVDGVGRSVWLSVRFQLGNRH